MSDDTKDRGYRVGYGKPPKNWQFKPGKSGNPNGRRGKKAPDGATNLLDKPVPVRHGDQVIRMRPKELAMRQQVKNGCEGDDFQALKHLLDQFEAHGLLAAYQSDAGGGVLELSEDTMPFHMHLILATSFGLGPWSQAELRQAGAEYVKDCTPVQAKIDAAIGYSALKENKDASSM
jgi:hypothetical protein